MVDYKGRILFFHGLTQTSQIFYSKTSGLRKKLNKIGYKCIYLNGPLRLTPSDLPFNDSLSKFDSAEVNDHEENSLRAWWLKSHLLNNNINIGPAIDTIKDYIDNNKIIDEPGFNQDENETDKALPIVGMIGFSQGAALVGLLMNKFNDIFNTSIKFVVLYSGFKVETDIQSGNVGLDHYYDSPKHQFKVLQVIGELDSVVEEKRGLNLYELTKDYCTLLRHPGGHFVPNSKIYVEQVTNWIIASTEEKVTEEEPPKKSEKDELDDILHMMDTIGK